MIGLQREIDMTVQEQQLENQCTTFNDAYPIGSTVKVTDDEGYKVERKVQSEAWVLGAHTPVVMLEGISGAYLLSRCAA